MDKWLKQLMWDINQNISAQEMPDHVNYQCMK